MLSTKEQIRVRYAETDQMGFAYHGNYLPWLEMARTSMLREAGIPYKALEAEGFFLPVLEANLQYKRPAFYDDEITVIASLKEKPLLRIRIDYEVRRGEELLAVAHTLHAFINKQGQPVRPPAAFVKCMDELFAKATA